MTKSRPGRAWPEFALVVLLYLVYGAVRNAFGGNEPEALRNAVRVLDLESVLHLRVEHGLQHGLLGSPVVLVVANYLYSSLHFVVTIGTLVFLYRRFPSQYPTARNAIVVTTLAALVGFAVFPLMPPRLLPSKFGFVDTLARYPTLWSFDSGAMHRVSNQFAAMPSLHVAWAVWCAVWLNRQLSNARTRALALAYPAATTFAIVITGNHYLLDALAGLATAMFGLGVATAWARCRRHHPTRAHRCRGAAAVTADSGRPFPPTGTQSSRVPPTARA